jgi:hypothetical protein
MHISLLREMQTSISLRTEEVIAHLAAELAPHAHTPRGFTAHAGEGEDRKP